jgi:tRNA(fMet)-specific endonuclease VapC
MLDTNTASALIKNLSPLLRERIARVPPARTCLSAISEGELRYGLARLPTTRHAPAALALLATVPILPWDGAAAAAYGALRATQESRGRPLGALDTLIAAHAIAAGAVLVSADRAFAGVPGLAHEDWTR